MKSKLQDNLRIVGIVSFGIVFVSIDTPFAVVASRDVSNWIPDLSIKG